MRLYVISTKYQPLVAIKKIGAKEVIKKNASTLELQVTFNLSKGDPLIAFDNINVALKISACLLTSHNIMPDLIEPDVSFFAVPVIYALEVEEDALPEPTILTADDLINYADRTTIPCYQPNEDQDDIIKKVFSFLKGEAIKIRRLEGLRLEQASTELILIQKPL